MKKTISIILIISALVANIGAQSTSDVAVIMKAANEKLKKQNYTSAIKDYNKVLRISPGMAEALRYRAEAKYNLGQYDEAMRDIDKAIEVNKDDAVSYYTRSLIFSANKKYADALLDLEKATTLKPQYYEATAQKAFIYYQRGDEKAAFEFINNNIEKSPDAAELIYCRGILYSNKQKYEKALNDLNKCYDIDPNYNTYNVFLARGSAHLGLEEYSQAETEFTSAIELVPNNATGYSSRAKIKYEQGKYTEAIADYRKAVEQNPDNSASYFNLGMAYYKLDDLPNACEQFHKGCSMGNQNACKMILVGCSGNK